MSSEHRPQGDVRVVEGSESGGVQVERTIVSPSTNSRSETMLVTPVASWARDENAATPSAARSPVWNTRGR